jgi:hypothetical protein
MNATPRARARGVLLSSALLRSLLGSWESHLRLPTVAAAKLVRTYYSRVRASMCRVTMRHTGAYSSAATQATVKGRIP